MRRLLAMLSVGVACAGAVLLAGPAAGAFTPAPAPSCPYSYLGSINGLYDRSAAPWFNPPRGNAFGSNNGSLNTLQISFAADVLQFDIPVIGGPNPAYAPARGVLWDAEYNDMEFQRQYDVNDECQQAASQQVVRDNAGRLDQLSTDLASTRVELNGRFDAAESARADAEARLNSRLDGLSAQIEAVRAQEAANAATNAATLKQVLDNQAQIIQLLLTPQGQRPGFPAK